MTAITVTKKRSDGTEVMSYPGEVLARTDTMLVVDARFTAPDRVFHGMLLRKDDPFVEAYFSDRWYNIYEIYDKLDGKRKGWYCNVSRPAIWNDEALWFEDLALDLLVFPDGKILVLDEDEFALLTISAEEREQALQALSELQSIFAIPADFDLRRDLIKRDYMA